MYRKGKRVFTLITPILYLTTHLIEEVAGVATFWEEVSVDGPCYDLVNSEGRIVPEGLVSGVQKNSNAEQSVSFPPNWHICYTMNMEVVQKA
jgi:hypothetical protein